MKRFATLFLLVLALNACDWPVHGEGGFDEAFSYSRFKRAVILYDDDLERAHISRRIDIAKRDLDYLTSNGGRDFSPADLRINHILWGRITRAFTAEMFVETEQDLNILEASILDIRRTIQLEQSTARNKEPQL